MSRDHNIGIEVCDRFTELLDTWKHPEAEAVKVWVGKQRRAIEVIGENRERKKVRVGIALTTAPPPILPERIYGSQNKVGQAAAIHEFIMSYSEWYNGMRMEAIK